jgi:hypothetical protein
VIAGVIRAKVEKMQLMSVFLRPGQSRQPASILLLVVVATFAVAAVGTVTPAAQTPPPTGNNAARANSYDDAWQDGPSGWVANAKAILGSRAGKTDGFLLWIGDSLTRNPALGAWAQNGAGRTPEDLMIVNWMHASTAPVSLTSKDGFRLAAPYICSARSYTVGDGLGAWHFMGTGMPPDTNYTTAAQKLQNCTTYPNILNLQTIITVFLDAEFAIPLVNLLAENPADVSSLTSMLNLMIANRIVPIISTYTYRGDAKFNLLVDQYNVALTNLARTRKLPLIDLNQEMLLRVPFSQWNGRFLGDGVHYTSGGGGYTSTSNPYADGGDPATHTTGPALTYNGYGLRGWLAVQKMKEIKQLVFDSVPTPPNPPTNVRIIR